MRNAFFLLKQISRGELPSFHPCQGVVMGYSQSSTAATRRKGFLLYPSFKRDDEGLPFFDERQ